MKSKKSLKSQDDSIELALFTEPEAPPAYIPEITNKDEVVQVYIEDKCVTAYKTPLVNRPPSRLADIKTFQKTSAPSQPGTKLPDLFPDLNEKTRQYLQLGEYGDNIIMNKKYITRLLQYYFESRRLKLPSSTAAAFREHMNLLREILNICSLEEAEAKTKEAFPGSYESMYTSYRCVCIDKKKKNK